VGRRARTGTEGRGDGSRGRRRRQDPDAGVDRRPRSPPVRRQRGLREGVEGAHDAGSGGDQGRGEREAEPGRRRDHCSRPRRDGWREHRRGEGPRPPASSGGHGSLPRGSPSRSPAATATTSRSPGRSTAPTPSAPPCARRSAGRRDRDQAHRDRRCPHTGHPDTGHPGDLQRLHCGGARGRRPGGARTGSPRGGARDRRERYPRRGCSPAWIRSNIATS
jgi:hypothetical protein